MSEISVTSASEIEKVIEEEWYSDQKYWHPEAREFPQNMIVFARASLTRYASMLRQRIEERKKALHEKYQKWGDEYVQGAEFEDEEILKLLESAEEAVSLSPEAP